MSRYRLMLLTAVCRYRDLPLSAEQFKTLLRFVSCQGHLKWAI